MTPTRGPKRRWPIVASVAGFAAIAVGLVWFGQRQLIYFPDSNDPGSAADSFESGSDVELSTSDDLKLSAWLVEPANPRDVAVLYLPGNGGNRDGRIEVGQALADEGFTVLLLDYRGYGGNPGTPTEAGLLLDAQAAAAYLGDAGFAPERMIYVGESIGTGVAAQLAVSDPVAGMVLRSPFTSLAAVARYAVGVPVGWLLRDNFDTEQQMRSIEAPTTVLAGDADDIIPIEESAAVADAAANLYRYVELTQVGHNDAVWFGPYLAEMVVELADAAIGHQS